MKKAIFVATFSILILGGIFYQNNRSSNNTSGGEQHSGSATQNIPQAKDNEVQMSEFSYKQSKITVKKGTTVTWANLDDAHHNVAFDTGSLKGMETKLIGKGEKVEFTFNDAGSFSYHCAPHPYMKATVVVTE